MNTVKTKKGSVLPLTNLKGKDYLMVAYRLQWLSEDVENYTIETDVTIGTDSAVVKAAVILLDKDNKLVRKAQATKRETLKDFPDYIEKAETGAVGRALAMLGFGTQHALADLDEGTRLADAPLVNTKITTEKGAALTPSSAAPSVGSAQTPPPSASSAVANTVAPRRSSSFKNRPKTEVPVVTPTTKTVGNGAISNTTQTVSDDWS